MLEPDKVLTEMAYLAIAIGKTAGPREREAWGWIEDKVAEALGLRGARSRSLTTAEGGRRRTR